MSRRLELLQRAATSCRNSNNDSCPPLTPLFSACHQGSSSTRRMAMLIALTPRPQLPGAAASSASASSRKAPLAPRQAMLLLLTKQSTARRKPSTKRGCPLQGDRKRPAKKPHYVKKKQISGYRGGVKMLRVRIPTDRRPRGPTTVSDSFGISRHYLCMAERVLGSATLQRRL